MLLAVIINRMDGKPYTEDDKYCMYDYASFFEMHELINAIDNDNNEEIQRILCTQVRCMHPEEQQYVDFINSNNWL